MMETDPLPASNGAATPAPVVAPPVQITRVNDRLSESLKLEHQLVKVSIRRLGAKPLLKGHKCCHSICESLSIKTMEITIHVELTSANEDIL